MRQIRLGDTAQTRGTAYVVYEDLQDARTACEKLSGFNFMNRYLITLYHQPEKTVSNDDIAKRQEALSAAKAKYGID